MKFVAHKTVFLASVVIFTTMPIGSGQAATLQTVGVGSTLVTIDSTAPATVARSVAVTGLAAGTTLGGIDYRPASPRVLYGISNVGQIYAINARSGAATAIGTPPLPTVSGIGFDFNPVVDRIRVVTQVGQNARVVPDTGALAATDTPLAYAAGDAGAGQVPTVAGAAYTSNIAGATTTTLYAIDTRGGLAPARLVTIGSVAGTVSPNTGALFTVGSTGVASASSVGFDIARDGTAYATLTNPANGATSLYTVNLTTGATTLVGALAGNTTYNGLAVQLASFASMGVTANQAAAGGALDVFTGIPSGALLGLFNAIDAGFATPGAQSDALAALTPAAFSNLPDLSLTSVETQETSVLRYTRDLRGQAMADGKSATLDADGRIGAWIAGGARLGHIKAEIDRPRASSDEVHFLVGVDYRLNPKTAIGVFGGYSDSDDRLTRGSPQSDLDSWFAGGYGTAAVGPVYVDFWGSYTDLKWKLRRGVTIGAFTDVGSARSDGRILTAGAATGLSYSIAGFEVEPFASVRYADLRLDGFTEAGGPTALTVDEFNRVSVRSNAGARIGAAIEGMGVTIRPQLRGSWYHEFRDQPRTISANFVDPTVSTPFGFTTTPLSSDYFNAGAALSIGGGGPLSIFADYDMQLDNDRRFSAFTIGARFVF